MIHKVLKILLYIAITLGIVTVVVCITLIKQEPADIKLNTVEEKFVSEYADVNMSKSDGMLVKKVYGINTADCEDYLYYDTEDTMDVREFLMIKTVDEDQTDVILDAIDRHLNNQKKVFENRGALQNEMLDQAVMYHVGNYVCFFISDNAKEWVKMVKKMLGTL